MANMYPKNISEYLPTDSERIVYQELKNQLPDTFDVFYSVSWTSYYAGRLVKSEADFIVASPDYGFLCLEVKGGNGIRIEDNNWYLSDAVHGERKLNSSPYDQAEKNMYYFSKVFSSKYNTKYSGIYGAGVIFPFYPIGEELELSNRHRTCTIDSNDLNNIYDRIKKMFRLWAGSSYGRRYYPASQHRAFLELIRDRIAISAAAGALIRFKDQQLSVINRVQDNYVYLLKNVKQFYMRGGAGTGKTWIAMKMAKDEAESNGHKVLFVCASKPLASMVNSHIGDAVDVKDIRSLFEMLVEDITSYQEPLFEGISHGLIGDYEKYKEKPVDEQFEDRIWLMFAGMGFYGLNAENGILISYDFSNDDLKERIGVLAVDDETALVGLCHASEAIIEKSFAAEITAFSDKISGIRKEVLKQFPGRKLKFIWASHNFIMNRRDLALLDKAGMAYFSDTTVEYYTDLAKHLGSCSRYQLSGSLFANQEIKNMDDKVPAIQGKMGGYTYYSFSIEPEKLLKIGYVLHRSEANKNMMPTYQRLIKKKRLQEVRSFINDGGYFPNSIIISIDTNGKGLVFDQSASKVDSTISKIGILHIPKRYRSAYIIDGQHRLYGYSDSLYAETNTIPVVAFVDLERSEQIKLFMDINENQKAVPKSLRVTLNADMLWESPDFSEQRQALRSKIAQMLGEESTSPLNSRIVIGENESTPTRCITVEAIQSALKKCRFFDSYGKKNVLQKEGTFDCKDNQETCDLFYPFIEKCLLYIRETCLDEWDKGDQDSGMLTMNRGIQAVIRVIDDVVNMLVEKGMIQPKTQALDDMFGLIQYYLKPLTDYINNLNAEQRKDLRGYFGGGADTRFWRAYQKAIADMRPDFVPDGLEEFWQNETKIYNEETKSMLREIEAKVKLLISERLGEYFGDSWLIKGLPKNIYTRAKGEADEAMYVHVSSTGEEIDIPIWDYVTLPECKQIILNGKNWSLFFEDTFVRPEEANLVGGKDPKTDWILRVNSISNKLSKESYSVPVDEYSYVKSIYDWLMGILVF